jgi:hypothetical protein
VSVIFAYHDIFNAGLRNGDGSLDFITKSNKSSVETLVSIFGLPFRFSNRSLFRTSLAGGLG